MKKELENVGGLMYLMGLQEDIPAIGLIEQHAKIIKEKAIFYVIAYSFLNALWWILAGFSILFKREIKWQ